MSSLILMYVYYDENKDIKAITSLPDDLLSDKFSLSMFPLSEVEGFLQGKKNPFDYSITKIKKITGETFRLEKKQREILLTRTLDNYLTKVEPYDRNETILKIMTDLNEKKIILTLDSSYKDLYLTGNEEQYEDIDAFINSSISYLHFTKSDDPYHFYFSIPFSPRELFEAEQLFIEYDNSIDLSDSSVYTRKLLNSYGYYIKGKKYV